MICNFELPKLGDLTSIQEVGVGLYLALAIVQSLSAGGVSSLKRKAASLREAASANSITTLGQDIRRIETKISMLDIDLVSFQSRLFWVVLSLITVAIFGLIYTSINGQEATGCIGLLLFLTFYVGIPFMIFFFCNWVIRRRSREVRKDFNAANVRLREIIAARPG